MTLSHRFLTKKVCKLSYHTPICPLNTHTPNQYSLILSMPSLLFLSKLSCFQYLSSSVHHYTGFNLLWRLENIVSTPKFETFASDYIKHFMPGVVTSGEFRDYFVNYFRMESMEIRDQIVALDWDNLFYSTGMPTDVPDFSNSLSRDAMALANEWKQGTGKGRSVGT